MKTGEQILAEGCGRGDNAARRELYDRYAALLLGLCQRYVGDRATAEDVLHDAFLKIFGAIGRFRYRGEGSLRAWMERIAVNTALEHLRRERRLGEVRLEESRALPAPSARQATAKSPLTSEKTLSWQGMPAAVCPRPSTAHWMSCHIFRQIKVRPSRGCRLRRVESIRRASIAT